MTPNYWVKFIGPDDYPGLTKEKYYHLCEKYDNEYFYFMNDFNKFVGIRQKNFLGGKAYFERLPLKNLMLEKLYTYQNEKYGLWE